MGICGSVTEDQKRERERAKEVDNKMKADKDYNDQLIKLLLLGAGESGKSTIFKQMRILYGEGFGEESRRSTAPVIVSNLIGGTRTVNENCEKLGFPLKDPASIEACKVCSAVVDDTVMTDEIAEAIKQLWVDEDFQETYKLRSKFQLFDCYADFAKSLYKKYPKWAGPNWIPEVDDVMKARVRTSGIVEEKYVIDGINFRMYDVGGQRNERKKWIHCFENVTAIIFVGALSEYDQVLYEDKTQNRLVEAVELFEEICNSRWFVETSIILFLNKKDLFEDKFTKAQIPLNITGLPMFESWEPLDWSSTTAEEGLAKAHAWILDRFMEQKQNPAKEVYSHITCATDTKNVATVFDACKDIILKANLKTSGFMA